MPTVRITEFRAISQDASTRIRALLEEGAKVYRASPKCTSCQVLQQVDEPTRLILLEAWQNIAERARVSRQVPSHVVGEAMKLSADAPSSSDLE